MISRRTAVRRTVTASKVHFVFAHGIQRSQSRAESVNVSLRGIYFNTMTPVSEGEIVEVLLKMPEEVSGEETTEWRCTGHVVRVEPFDSPKGKLGVGVQFYCYEAARPEQARLPLGAVDRRLPELRSGEAR
jgi:PilZ domain